MHNAPLVYKRRGKTEAAIGTKRCTQALDRVLLTWKLSSLGLVERCLSTNSEQRSAIFVDFDFDRSMLQLERSDRTLDRRR
jgi:hypothetical protein